MNGGDGCVGESMGEGRAEGMEECGCGRWGIWVQEGMGVWAANGRRGMGV